MAALRSVKPTFLRFTVRIGGINRITPQQYLAGQVETLFSYILTVKLLSLYSLFLWLLLIESIIMGIFGLSKLLADNAPSSIKENEIKNYFGKWPWSY